MQMRETTLENPISELISDEIYSLLLTKNLINEKNLRDYKIKKQFRELRNNSYSSTEAIETIRKEYPYLQFDSIRKIIYLGNRESA
jgi:predicted ATP-binding protein involved in virulence